VVLSAGFLRRLGAWFYDLLAIATILVAAALVAVASNSAQAIPAENLWFKAYLWLLVGAYFYLSWRLGGQTLGMRPWRLQLLDLSGGRPSRSQLLIRFAGAWLSFLAGGLGFLWALIPPQRATWHDLLSRTRVCKRLAT